MTLQATPGQLVFGQNIIPPIKLAANWAFIAQRKQERINKPNTHKNKKHIHYKYKVGEKVLLDKQKILQKMTSPCDGPCKIQKVLVNGTV